MARQFVIEPILLTCHQLSVCVKWTKRQIKKCITGKNQAAKKEAQAVCTHPKAGKKWSVDIVGKVADALSSFDLTKHESYGGAFGPGMEKQTITTKGLVQLSEVDTEAENQKFRRRQKARKAIRREQAEDAMGKQDGETKELEILLPVRVSTPVLQPPPQPFQQRACRRHPAWVCVRAFLL